MSAKFWVFLAIIFFNFSRFESLAADEFQTTYIFGVDTRWLSVEDGKFEVVLSDQVTDGCWTSSKSAKTAVELEITRSGYELVGDDEYANNSILLTSVGFLKAGVCVATYEFEIYAGDSIRFYKDEHEVLSLYKSRLWGASGVLTGGKDKMNVGLKEAYVDMAQEFLVNIGRQKSNALKVIRERAQGEEKVFWEKYN